MERVLTIFGILCVHHVKNILASTGDRSQMFYTCLQNCLAENCSGITRLFVGIFMDYAADNYCQIKSVCCEKKSIT
jgi:hypothetical protein